MNKELIKELAQDIKLLEETKLKIKEIKDASDKKFEEDTAILFKELNLHNFNITEEKFKISEEAKTEFVKDGIKKLYGGIGIRENKGLIYDEAAAFTWAKEKQMFISFDKKAFEKVAESLNLDFVKSSIDISVTFPAIFKLED